MSENQIQEIAKVTQRSVLGYANFDSPAEFIVDCILHDLCDRADIKRVMESFRVNNPEVYEEMIAVWTEIVQNSEEFLNQNQV